MSQMLFIGGQEHGRMMIGEPQVGWDFPKKRNSWDTTSVVEFTNTDACHAVKWDRVTYQVFLASPNRDRIVYCEPGMMEDAFTQFRDFMVNMNPRSFRKPEPIKFDRGG